MYSSPLLGGLFHKEIIMSQLYGIVIKGLCFSLLSFGVAANTIEKTFYPEVTIFKTAPSDTIEIKAERFDFLTTYSVSLQRFKPLDIPFVVRSVQGTALTYDMTLRISQHYCRTNNVDTELSGVTTTLNGLSFPLFGSRLPGAGGVKVTGKAESKHVMRVSFPEFQQTDKDQACFGTFVLMAEVEA